MNKLLSDYEAARKAIFDHCGVPDKEWWHNVDVDSCPGVEWILDKQTVEVRHRGPGKFGYHYRVEQTDDFGLMCFRGQDVTVILVDTDQSDDPIYAWLALDNAMEVKP